MGILALIAEFENDLRRERQMDGIKKARAGGDKVRASFCFPVNTGE
jgi:DNA invertase Pin-like site-specific DNA recombinase